MKIESLRVRAVAAPMKRALATSTGAISVAPLLLIDLQTDAGIVGRSYLFGLMQQNLKPLAALVELMGEMVKGDAVLPFDIEAKLRKRHTLLGVHNIVLFAMSGIDMAAWDALAQSMQQPLVRLLGGAPRPVRAYNSKGLGIMPLKSLAKEAEELVGEGFRAVKLRLGRPGAEDDLAALRAVKKAIGPGITKKDCALVVDGLLNAIKNAMADHTHIEIRGFGTFKVRKRRSRMARNPRTGDPVEVPARAVPIFKPSKELRAQVSEGVQVPV